MRFQNLFGAIFSLLSTASATTVSYDLFYDDPTRPLDIVACSDGVNGLMWKYGWKVLGDVKSPLIGGAEAVKDWNSPNCGTCWSATYNGTTVYVLAIDHANDGLNLGLRGMDQLTGGLGMHLGVVDAFVAQVPNRACGL